MIADQETNTVYFSELLKSQFAETCEKITSVLDSLNITYHLLPNTKDIWARDYMPIQVSKSKYVEYRYDPDYLQAKKYRKVKSYPDIICDTIGLKTYKTDLVIDGGNVIKSQNCVIMTDKVLVENSANYKPVDLIEKLKLIFEVDKIALIPWDKESDPFGHADGMVRFIDNETVLLQGYFDSYEEKFKKQLYDSLEFNGLTWKKMNFDVEKESDRNWAYMNYLQTKDLILVPAIGIDEDEQALKQIHEYFPHYSKQDKIRQVDMADIEQKGGGVLNCISWTVQN